MAKTVRDVMTSDPIVLPATGTVLEAARAMRDSDVGNVIVGDESGTVVGIITDRDVVVRVVADARDAQTVELREVASSDLATLSPDDSVDDALRLMEENAVRRLPVLDGGRAVGVVALGDLATQAHGEEALDEISAAPPNN